MAKRNDKIIKKILPNGDIEYYRGGKKLLKSVGRRLWLLQQQKTGEKPFTRKELNNQKKSNEFEKNWKFKGFPNVSYAIVDILDAFGIIDKNNVPNKDLYNVLDANGNRLFNNYKDILDEVKRITSKTTFQWDNQVGLPGYRNRQDAQNIVDIIDLLDSPNYRYYKFIVYDDKNVKHEGRVHGLLAVQKFETMITSVIKDKIDNSAFVKFSYRYKVDPAKKTITLSLKDIDKKNTLEKIVKKAEGTGAKQTITIRNKYKDVVIEIKTS
jgi:hypothetical protein